MAFTLFMAKTALLGGGCGDRVVNTNPVQCPRPEFSALKNPPTHPDLRAPNGTACYRMEIECKDPCPSEAKKLIPTLVNEINSSLGYKILKASDEKTTCSDTYKKIYLKWVTKGWTNKTTTISVASTTYQNNQAKGLIVKEATIYFNAKNFKYSYFYLKDGYLFWPDILRHEVGHVLGLPHTKITHEKRPTETVQCTMYKFNYVFDIKKPDPSFQYQDDFCSDSRGFAKYIYAQCPNMQ